MLKLRVVLLVAIMLLLGAYVTATLALGATGLAAKQSLTQSMRSLTHVAPAPVDTHPTANGQGGSTADGPVSRVLLPVSPTPTNQTLRGQSQRATCTPPSRPPGVMVPDCAVP